MKTIILFFALCLTVSAAPLPPFPTVKRPAPLLSPKAASAPKSVPMLKFTPASVPSGTPIIKCVYTLDQPGLFEGTIVDRTTVDAIQPVAKGCRIEMTENMRDWDWVVDSPTTAYEQLVGFDWYHETWQRRHHLMFRRVLYTPTAARMATASGGIKVNKSLPGAIHVHSRPK